MVHPLSRGRYEVRTRVYVAGPISVGDIRANCLRAVKMGFALMDAGYAPYVPHYSWFVDVDSTIGKGRYEQWLSLDKSWISICDALLRLSGTSVGADREVAWAKSIGVPVYYDLQALLDNVKPTQFLEVTG